MAKGYDVETMPIHFNMDDFQIKTKEYAIVLHQHVCNLRQSLKKIGATFEVESIIFEQRKCSRLSFSTRKKLFSFSGYDKLQENALENFISFVGDTVLLLTVSLFCLRGSRFGRCQQVCPGPPRKGP